MTDLITLAREKLAFDNHTHESYCRYNGVSDYSVAGINFVKGGHYEHARTAPIMDALLNCADVLEKIILLMEGSPSIAPYTDAMVLELARQRRDELEKAVRGER